MTSSGDASEPRRYGLGRRRGGATFRPDITRPMMTAVRGTTGAYRKECGRIRHENQWNRTRRRTRSRGVRTQRDTTLFRRPSTLSRAYRWALAGRMNESGVLGARFIDCTRIRGQMKLKECQTGLGECACRLPPRCSLRTRGRSHRPSVAGGALLVGGQQRSTSPPDALRLPVPHLEAPSSLVRAVD